VLGKAPPEPADDEEGAEEQDPRQDVGTQGARGLRRNLNALLGQFVDERLPGLGRDGRGELVAAREVPVALESVLRVTVFTLCAETSLMNCV
jgi:hypothetical protein